MLKRNTKGVVDLKHVSVVHLNVSSGYLAFVESRRGEEPRVRGVNLGKSRERATGEY